ncbi:hypothetical protein [Pedococcus sp. 5OH_020]|uniref:hypothetical protein n=1 Tax=Pedococcus sp. 5OH_020 TaxID=2989814 RepID=UPI0022E9C3C7|nr:hypothetical protein [Pedococcus sp. 5OH_020]
MLVVGDLAHWCNRRTPPLVHHVMTEVKSAVRATTRICPAYGPAGVLLSIGVFFLLAGLDPFLIAGLATLAATLALIGGHAGRPASWPSAWRCGSSRRS